MLRLSPATEAGIDELEDRNYQPSSLLIPQSENGAYAFNVHMSTPFWFHITTTFLIQMTISTRID